MKNKLFTMFIVVLSLLISKSYCQTRGIIISGRVDTALMKSYASNELILTMRFTINVFGKGEKIAITNLDSEGKFKVKINTDSIMYLSFDMPYNGKSSRPGTILNVNFQDRSTRSDYNEVYLFEKGDSVDVSILNGGRLFFKGKGADKLNCQYLMYTVDTSPTYEKRQTGNLFSQGDFSKGLLLKDKISNSAIQMRLDILESFKTKLTFEVYNILYVDAIASAKYQLLHSLPSLIISNTPKMREAVRDYYENHFKELDSNQKISPTYLDKSAFYAELKFSEYNLNKFIYNIPGTSETAILNKLYDDIKCNYSGELRDKLIYVYFEYLNRKNSTIAKANINDALSIMGNGKLKSLLIRSKNDQYLAFPFELCDTNGKFHRLKDYTGKTIVIDFWYTGCVYCAILNLAMEPIIKRFNENKNIVFITVSVDANFESWKRSVASGKYTSSETINLYTNGMGSAHPIIQNYNFNAYPQQIVISKNGKLITSTPPRVDTKSNIQPFLDLIYANL